MKVTIRKVLVADEGKVLTNGETFAQSVVLGDWDKPENWNEITKAEQEEIMASREAESDGSVVTE